ncbi:MAG: 50S ribosomal protein L4 [Bacteroidales bacterium]|nr:50S ribosomal protein L4 [Bacteroidales bacterium]MDY2917579.1 50S ribosomal protein L4 [Muribaculaceae bacterium]
MEVAIYNQEGQDTGRKAVLNDEVFAIEPNEHILYLDVKQYLAAQRQGTHKSKERSEVSGSTRKLHKQKGGGGSRIGDINSPVLVGGGRVFGPRPRDYRFKLNKKMKQLARRSALSLLAANNGVIVVEDIKLAAPKTKDFIKVTDNLKVADKKVLVVMEKADRNVLLSARNVPDTALVAPADLNAYTVLNNNALVITESALETINKL